MQYHQRHRPLRDLATGALREEEEDDDEPAAPRRSLSAPSAAAATSRDPPSQRWRGELLETASEPVLGRSRGTGAGPLDPAQPLSPPISGSAGGTLSPRSAGGASRGDWCRGTLSAAPSVPGP